MTFKIKNIIIKILTSLLAFSMLLSLTALIGCSCNSKNETKSISLIANIYLKVDESYLLEPKLDNINTELEWTSSNDNVAVVNEQGVVVAKGVGSCEITVSGDGETATCLVNVSLTDSYPQLKVNTDVVGVQVNDIFALDTKLFYRSNYVQINFTYESMNNDIATINSNGVITGVSAGRTEIIISLDYLTYHLEKIITVNVYDNVVFHLSNNNVNLSTLKENDLGYNVSETLTFGCNENGLDVLDQVEIEWSIEDANVVSISGNGNSVVLNSISAGETKVIASFTYKQTDYSVFANVKVFKASVQEGEKLFVEKVNGNNQVNLDVPEYLSVNEINEIIINGTAIETINKDIQSNTVILTIDDSVSVYDIEINSNKLDYSLTIVVADKVFRQSDVNNFSKIISQNLNGYYLLAEDLDFTGITFQSIGGASDVFSGHFDGCGYAIKNLVLTARTEKDQWGVYKTGAGNVFGSNSGTIENVFVQFTAPAVNAWVGFVGFNTGKVRNVLVDVTLSTDFAGGYAQCNGAVVSANKTGGTVSNCIGSINVGNNLNRQQFGTVVGANYTNTLSITNCYGLLNGSTQIYGTNGSEVVNSFSHIDNVKLSMRECYNFNSSEAFLASGKELNGSSGWSEYWKKGNVTIIFGDESVGFMDVGIVEYSKYNDTEEKGVTYDFSTVTREEITSAKFDGIVIDSTYIKGTKITVPYSLTSSRTGGSYSLRIIANNDAYNLTIDIISAIFTQKDVNNFASVITSDLSGIFKLGEDLDFTGITFQSIGGASDVFSGHFDGCGYAIKNLVLTARTEKDQWGVYKTGAGNVFGSNTGTIENVFVQFTAPAVNAWVGFVGLNTGIVQNVFVDITLSTNFSGAFAQANGAVVSRNNAGGKVNNCIGSVNIADNAKAQQFGTVIGINHSSTLSIENCYGLLNDMSTVYGLNGSGVVNYHTHEDLATMAVKNCANFSDVNVLISQINSFSINDDWSEYWRINEGKLYFGDEVIASVIMVKPSDDCETNVNFTDIWQSSFQNR